ncbi:hypothetical protein, partial [Dyella sp. ASV21]|uniref:hypothetical protein n=1 Tax=Dyella sp. ASV21 TaxID=2795114 RepID=UPI0018EA3C5B
MYASRSVRTLSCLAVVSAMFMAAMPGLASAASSANAEFKVNLTINPDCNIDATDLNFGRHST